MTTMTPSDTCSGYFNVGLLMGYMILFVVGFAAYVIARDARFLWRSVRKHGGERERNLRMHGIIMQRLFRVIQGMSPTARDSD